MGEIHEKNFIPGNLLQKVFISRYNIHFEIKKCTYFLPFRV
jgi:hypothetical protein